MCVWSMHQVNGTGNSLSLGRPTPGVVKQDKSEMGLEGSGAASGDILFKAKPGPGRRLAVDVVNGQRLNRRLAAP